MTLYQALKAQLSLHQVLGIPESDKRETITCIAHEDAHPSLSVYPPPEAHVHCHVCGFHGDVLDVLAHQRGQTLKDVALELGAEMGLELPEVSAERRARAAEGKRRRQAIGLAMEWFAGKLLVEGCPGFDYLVNVRGLSAEVLQRWKVGYCPPGTDLCQFTMAGIGSEPFAGLSVNDFQDLGLISCHQGKWSDTFGGRVVFPYFDRSGRPIYMDARLIGPPADGEAKYLGLRCTKPAFYPDPKFYKTALLPEGITDTLTLMSAGIECRGRPGVQGFNPEALAKCERITFIGDRDSAGEKGVLTAIRETMKAAPTASVRLSRLRSDVNDVNDFLRLEGSDALKSLDEGRSAVLVLIDEMAAEGELDPDERIARLQPIYDLISLRNNETEIADYLEALKKVKVNKATARAEVKRALQRSDGSQHKPELDGEDDDEEIEVMYDPPEDVTPAQSFEYLPSGNMRAITTVYQTYKDKKDGWVSGPFVIRVEREKGTNTYVVEGPAFPTALGLTKASIAKIPSEGTVKGRWRGSPELPFSYSSFLDFRVDVQDTKQIYNALVSLTSSYIWLPEQRHHEVIAAYIMMTYVHRMLRAVPYLHLCGSAGTGKTQLLQILGSLCFNPQMAAQITPAALSRCLDADLPTLLFDEAEQFNHPKEGSMAAELSAILRSGYKKDATRLITEPNPDGGHRLKALNTFGPKVLASIQMLDHALATRCIQIPTLKPKKGTYAELKDLESSWTEQEPSIKELRDRLYCWSMACFEDIRLTVDLLSNSPVLSYLRARERELWIPILAITTLATQANAEDPDSIKPLLRIIELQKESEKANRAQAMEEQVDLVALACLVDVIREGQVPPIKENYYELRVVTEKVAEALVERSTINPDTKFTGRRMIAIIRRAQVKCERLDIKFAGRRVRAMAINLDDILERIEQISGIPVDEILEA